MPLSGKNNPNWKGGKHISSHGYVKVLVGEDHHLADSKGYAAVDIGEAPESDRFVSFPDNIYNGLTITNQQDADEKLPIFLQIPGKKWLSIEPMVGPIDLRIIPCKYCNHPEGDLYQRSCPYCSGFGFELPQQVILGGMSGPLAQKHLLQLEWVRQIIADCAVAGVPCFVKQLHIYREMYGDVVVSKEPAEWPEEFRVRQLAWGMK